MPKPYMLILTDEVVRAAISQAWVDSNPGISGGHEEGEIGRASGRERV